MKIHYCIIQEKNFLKKAKQNPTTPVGNVIFHKFLIRFRFSDKLSLTMKINSKNFTPTLSNAAHLRNRMRSEVILCKSKWMVEQSRSVYT